MNFKDRIQMLENELEENTYIFKIGSVPVMLTAVHTMEQIKENGDIKFSEPYTKAIAKYVSENTDSSYFIKVKDTKIDSNSLVIDEFKERLLQYIKDNNIKLVIDLHGASIERDFDVEFGTLNNLSADFSTIRELEDAFKEVGVKDVKYNNPFKGGGITQFIFDKTDIDVIQIEINGKFREFSNCEKIEKICNALINFIRQYNSYNNI